jgi:plastocyanin
MARHEVHMKQGPNRYDPETVNINLNDEVVWVNDGGTHNAAGDNGSPGGFDTGDVVGTSAPVQFNALSTDPLGFRYSCSAHHPTMVGHVIVVPAGTPLVAPAKKADGGSY